MSNWLDLSNNANTFKSTYIKGFLDISGGILQTRSSHDHLFISGDASLNRNLYVGGDISWNPNNIPSNSIPVSALVGGINSTIGPTGEKGEIGEKGDNGSTGPIGEQGNTGPTGPNGAKGDIGLIGNTGPAGQKGDTGEKGEQGDVGATGYTGTFEENISYTFDSIIANNDLSFNKGLYVKETIVTNDLSVNQNVTVNGNIKYGDGSTFRSVKALNVDVGSNSSSSSVDISLNYGQTYTNASDLIFSLTPIHNQISSRYFNAQITSYNTSSANIHIEGDSTWNFNLKISVIIYELYSPYFTISSSSTHRIFTTNITPTFDDWDNYVSVNPNDPVPRDPPLSIQVPITPNLPSNINTYYKYNNEFADGTLTSFTNLHDEPSNSSFTIAVLGRFSQPNTHWSSTNGPLEIVLLDPLPAATGGKLLNNGFDSNHLAQDVATATNAPHAWDEDGWVVANSDWSSFTTYNTNQIPSNVDPDLTRWRMGYYFRYNLSGVHTKLGALMMDAYGGHTQPDGDWHIHINDPVTGKGVFVSGYENCIVGYAIDGVPILGLGSTVYNSSNVSQGTATSNWRLRTNSEYTDTYTLNNVTYNASQNGGGAYIYDHIYDSSTAGGNLDHFNGGYATIDGSLIYCYFITSTYPVWPRNIRGEIKDVLISS